MKLLKFRYCGRTVYRGAYSITNDVIIYHPVKNFYPFSQKTLKIFDSLAKKLIFLRSGLICSIMRDQFCQIVYMSIEEMNQSDGMR